MDRTEAMQVMSALSQPVRLQVYELLLQQFPDGLAAGDIADATRSSPSAISAHLAVMSRAGLVQFTKVGRSVIYEASPARVAALSDYLGGLSPM